MICSHTIMYALRGDPVWTLPARTPGRWGSRTLSKDHFSRTLNGKKKQKNPFSRINDMQPYHDVQTTRGPCMDTVLCKDHILWTPNGPRNQTQVVSISVSVLGSRVRLSCLVSCTDRILRESEWTLRPEWTLLVWIPNGAWDPEWILNGSWMKPGQTLNGPWMDPNWTLKSWMDPEWNLERTWMDPEWIPLRPSNPEWILNGAWDPE